MVRKLFVDPSSTPTLFGTRPSDVDGAQILANIAGTVMNPGQAIGPTLTGAAQVLDDVIDTTPGSARMLMAYTIGKFTLMLVRSVY